MVQRAVSPLAKVADCFSDWRWRLNNLYWITDKDGRRVQFRLNWAQAALYDEMHYMNLILKARQLGFTTFIQLFMLDACTFNSNVRAGTIAHTLGDAQVIFRDKVKYPYDNLPAAVRAAVPLVNDNVSELMLGNNSAIRVSTSMRSGTLQYLHVSEYGKMCAKFPHKAREVKTGALNAVQAGQVVFVESTAEGQEGDFYETCQQAQSAQRLGGKLSPLDFKFFFFPWWKCPDYVLDPAGIVIPEPYQRYFLKLRREHGIALTPAQCAWYVRKAESQRDDMKREFPSYPKEAFEASIEGAYYGEQIAAAELDGRIGSFPPLPDVPVQSAWDIGVGDATARWLFQEAGSRVRFFGYAEGVGEGAPYWVGDLRERERRGGWRHDRALMPHDAKVKEWGSGRTRLEQLEAANLHPKLVPRHFVDDGINAVRDIFAICEFDEAGCADGLKALRAYRKEWDEERGIWLPRPRHDWASHGADALRTFAMGFRETIEEPPRPDPIKELLKPRTWADVLREHDETIEGDS
jgi:hypothetical protein